MLPMVHLVRSVSYGDGQDGQDGQHYFASRTTPDARNARTHSDEQVAQVAASIAEFSFTNPILLGGGGVIIAADAR
jgi:hypothetical protein